MENMQHLSDGGGVGPSALQDRLTGALIGIARAVDGNEHLIAASTDAVVLEGLSATLVDFDAGSLSGLIRRAAEEKRRLIPNCFACASPCGKNNDYDMRRLWDADEEVRSLKLLLLFAARGIALQTRRVDMQGYDSQEISRFLYQALFTVGEESFGAQELLPAVKKAGEITRKIIARRKALTDKGNTAV